LEPRKNSGVFRLKYIAVTAVHNDEKLLKKSAQSVIEQIPSPDTYVIADDHSTDNTPKILKTLKCVKIRVEAPRSRIRGVNQCYALIKAVNEATKYTPNWDYLLKTDIDTILPKKYVHELIEYLEMNPKTGIVAGKSIYHNRFSRVSDAAKIYTRECWDTIKGLDIQYGFDSHAILKARQYGWKTETLEYVYFHELRPSSYQNLERWMQSGETRKRWGFPIWHTILASVKNLPVGRPIIVGPLTALLSHLLSNIKTDEQLDHDWIKRYAIHETLDILKGKNRISI
jgi:glycosyltransferase involved in cell wall biosynthesis